MFSQWDCDTNAIRSRKYGRRLPDGLAKELKQPRKGFEAASKRPRLGVDKAIKFDDYDKCTHGIN